ncbi:hypothetical protein DMN91_003985 [Ooceraea biroi]|uniref:Uncharacterized protein n=1 Tax=Ooceraea biroi TaxID=2015173 RepID=A0A3L8DTM8_OOCBI|nr:hypothetical protein DMN91_003985 [Ooceraea biroi]
MKNKSRRSNAVNRKKKIRDKDDWSAALDSMFINDDHWHCIAAMMMETIAEHSCYISLFHESVEEAEQTRIYSLSYQKAVDTIKTLSKQDPEKCSAIEGICHYASMVLDENNGHLSTWLVARIIKYLIYRTKIEHIGRLKADLGHGIEDRAPRNIDGAISTGSGISHRKADSESEYALTGKASAPLHGDAVPLDEPNLYVVLSGFRDPDLPAELLHVGVPLSCILEVRTSGPERYIMYCDTGEKDSTLEDGSRFPQDYHIEGKNALLKFWTVTHQRFANLSAYPAYSDIAVLTFYLPSLPETSNITEKESLKRDMYDKALLILRHLNDLRRQHAEYLGCMKLEKRIADKDEKMDTKIYEDALKDIPNEYINAPLILSAMLLQVESNLAGFPSKCTPDDTRFSDTRHVNSSTIAERIPVSIVRDKLILLDRKYELSDEYISISRSSQPAYLEVVPYADVLAMITSLSGSINLDDGVLRVLRDRRIINIWRNHKIPTKSKSEAYMCHINNIVRLLNGRHTVGYEEAVAYLHLLMFEKWIFPNSREIKAQLLTGKLTELKCTGSTIRRTQSAPDLVTESSSTMFSRLRRFKSDTEIDYDKPVVAFTDCPLLFALTDTKETLLPGYLFKNVWRTRSYERPSLDEYEDVELLSGRVFLQVVHECFQSFDRFAARYFEPTDSMLLYFSNNIEVGTTSERRRLSSIRTPVGLWEFCKYIVGEEENWIKRRGRETRRSRATDLTGRFTKKSIEMKEETIIFEDECFMLPDSLKARYLKESPDRDARKKISETRGEGTITGIGGRKVTRQKRNEAPNSESESSDGALTNGKTSMTEKKSDPKIDDVDTSFLPAKQILSFGCAEEEESRDVLGYDLERLRVQVIHHSKKFPLADTSVRVELEDWLHGDFSLRVAVTLQCCTLRLSSRVGHHQSPDTFHLTTKRGAVLSFCRNVQELAAVQNSFDCQRQNLAFDFRASWPSGLLIEPTIGDSTKNPFCIRQSYVPKCPGRAGAAREVCRNFLRNGTVLKYLDDNTVVILRPNGVIVTCMDFDEPRSHDEFIRQTAETTLKELRRNGSRQSGMAEHGEKVIGSTESHFDGSIVDIQPTKQHVLSGSERVIVKFRPNWNAKLTQTIPIIESNRGDPLIMEMFVTGKVLRYSVVNYDGRHYEMLNDLLVSEHDRLLVRTISDYEVGEMFTRRADGTDTLLRSNGELIVTFSDGTRIITNYVIEKESITCEWSQDELQRYFGFMTKETKEYNDGFVSVLLTFRVEHKDYAIVSYDQSAVGYTLSMPDDLHVSVSGRGHYEVSIEDELNLKTRDDRVLLTEMCATCGGKSSTTLKFWDFVQTSSRTILTTTDIFGNALEVKSDGSTSFHLETDLCVEGGHERNDDDDDVPEHNGERRNSEEQRAKSQARIHRKHERYCKMLKFPARSQYRIFAMNRDLTAREYLHRSVRREQEVAAVFGDETSMIQSKLLRSTSSPYNWLFPFGKRNQVVPEKMQNEVLTKRNELSLPKLLRVRIFFGIKEADRNILIDMQRAMGLYWIFVFRDGDKCRLFCATGPSRACEVENDYKSSEEEELRELALGVRKSIDVETYVRSLRGKLIKVSTEAVRQSSRLAELLQQRGSMKEEYEWYKQCMRKRIIMPYFQTIANSGYSLMKDLVNEAI